LLIHSNDVIRSSDGINWERVTRNNNLARLFGGLVVAKAPFGSTNFPAPQLYLIGGISVSSAPSTLTDIWTSTDAVSWSLVSSTAPFLPRLAFSVSPVNANSRIVVVGGFSDNTDGTLSNDVWISNIGASLWTQLSAVGVGPSGRGYAGLVNINDYLYLISGGANQASVTNDIWVSSDSGKTFSLITASDAFPPRFVANYHVVGRQVFISGGQSPTAFLNDVWMATFP